MIRRKTIPPLRIACSFQHSLALEDVKHLIESGLKLFLYQRGQIPVPFDSLNDKEIIQCHNNENEEEEEEVSNGINTTEPEEDDLTTPWKRQRDAIQKRRKMVWMRKNWKQNMKKLGQEFEARTKFENLFKVLRTHLDDAIIGRDTDNFGKIYIVLLFGPSIRSAKETIIFDVDENLVSKLASKSTPTSSLVRKFYRNIIMSEEFLELTSKPLGSTYTHLCIGIQTSHCSHFLADRTELILLEDFDISKAKKVLRVVLHPECETSSVEFDNSSIEDTTSYSFFQIPFRYKGIRCKKANGPVPFSLSQ